jgi:hypothetical protein
MLDKMIYLTMQGRWTELEAVLERLIKHQRKGFGHKEAWDVLEADMYKARLTASKNLRSTAIAGVWMPLHTVTSVDEAEDATFVTMSTFYIDANLHWIQDPDIIADTNGWLAYFARMSDIHRRHNKYFYESPVICNDNFRLASHLFPAFSEHPGMWLTMSTNHIFRYSDFALHYGNEHQFAAFYNTMGVWASTMGAHGEPVSWIPDPAVFYFYDVIGGPAKEDAPIHLQEAIVWSGLPMFFYGNPDFTGSVALTHDSGAMSLANPIDYLGDEEKPED